MASWVLVPALTALRAEFDKIAPGRDKSSDGSIGDDAHSTRSSDHNPDETGATPDEDSDAKNEVHAIDVDKDLGSGLTMQAVVDYLVSECRKNNPNGKDRGRLKYIIFNGYIWDAPGWSKVAYTGSNPHDKHAHFSCEYDSEYSEDASPWGLVEKFGASMATAKEVWDYLLEDPYDESEPPRKVSAGGWLRYVPSDADVKAVKDKVDDVHGKVGDLDIQMNAMQAQLDRIEQALLAHAGDTDVPGDTP